MNEHASPTAGQGSGHRTWLVAGVVAIVIAAIAVATILVIERRPDADYPSGSPEAALQDYVRAWHAGDADAAWEVVSTAAQERSTLDRFRAANRRRDDEVYRVWIDETSVNDERATLLLTVERLSHDGLLGPGRERRGTRMTLVQENGGWKVDNPTVVYSW